MKMDQELRLQKTASAIFSYVFNQYNSGFELPVKLPHVFSPAPNEDFGDDEGKAVLQLCLSLRPNFNDVFVKSYPNLQRSVKHFMTFLTSRCLKICSEDPFLSFIVSGAFIAELNLFCCLNECYTFLNTAPKCLIAIFNRRLDKEFYAKGGWETLRQFCENFIVKDGQINDVSGSLISISSLQTVLQLLEQPDSSSEEGSSDSDLSEDENEEIEDAEIDNDEEALDNSESDLGEESDEDDEDIGEDSDEDSDLDASPIDNKNQPKLNNVHSSTDSDDEDDEDAEDEDTDSSDESDPSSLSEDSSDESEVASPKKKLPAPNASKRTAQNKPDISLDTDDDEDSEDNSDDSEIRKMHPKKKLKTTNLDDSLDSDEDESDSDSESFPSTLSEESDGLEEGEISPSDLALLNSATNILKPNANKSDALEIVTINAVASNEPVAGNSLVVPVQLITGVDPSNLAADNIFISSELVGDDKPKSNTNGTEEVSQFIKQEKLDALSELDDISKLIKQEKSDELPELDDISKLIKQEKSDELDDISKIIKQEKTDELSELVNELKSDENKES